MKNILTAEEFKSFIDDVNNKYYYNAYVYEEGNSDIDIIPITKSDSLKHISDFNIVFIEISTYLRSPIFILRPIYPDGNLAWSVFKHEQKPNPFDEILPLNQKFQKT